MGFTHIRLGRKHLSWKQNGLVFFAGVLFVVLYFTLMPSASMFYEYVSANDILSTIVVAPLLTVSAELCPVIPAFNESAINIDLKPSYESLKSLSTDDGGSETGGVWRPKHCSSRHRVAIVVPYRKRPEQLEIFLYHMHRFLRLQLLDYRIIIVNQVDEHDFNRAALLNVGFVEALKLYSFHCFVFHDVDLLPERLDNMYVCSKSPRHMSVAINTMRYNLPYAGIFGGATAMTVEQFRILNGYSNRFFGWGGEDDDMYNRIRKKGMNIMRWDPEISRYYMLFHEKEKPNPDRFPMLNYGKSHYEDDGLNSLNYELLKVETKKLYTIASVKLIKKYFNNTI